MIIPAWKAYLRTVRLCKTPFVFPMDMRYYVPPLAAIEKYLKTLVHRKWKQHFFDCSSFAWVWKARPQEDEINSTGWVIGMYWPGKQPHCWNTFLSQDGDHQVEPQSGYTFKHDRRYWPWMVIL